MKLIELVINLFFPIKNRNFALQAKFRRFKRWD